jgi:hypothetical protein
MKCSEVRELISAHFDDELPPDVSTEVAKHLAYYLPCATELNGIRKLSELNKNLPTPAPPSGFWHSIREQLDEPIRITKSTWSFNRQTIACTVAALVLIAAGLFWFGPHLGRQHEHDAEFAAVFHRYLEEFHDSPLAAQDVFSAKYDGQMVKVNEATKLVGYRPAVADRMPRGYQIISTHVWKMPCCICVQCLCKREDGSTFAIFEHDEDEPEWFGERPRIDARFSGKSCQLVQLNGRLAVSWKLSNRYLTIIGAKDLREINDLVNTLSGSASS